MKPSVNDLMAPQTLSACHARIEQLTSDLAISHARIADLEGQNQALAEKVRDLAHRVFGRKSERRKAVPSEAVQDRDVTPKSPACDPSVVETEVESPPAATAEIDEPPVPPSAGRRRRGQQPEAPGHGRQRRSQVPGRIDFRDVPQAQQQCSTCGQWYVEAGVEEAEQIDWQVRVERVVIQRQRYRRTCACEGTPRSVTAPTPPSLIPKGLLTVPAVVTLLLMKYLWGLPLNRIIGMLAYQGCAISAGTLVGVLQRVGLLLEPLDQAFRARNRDEDQLNADETRWKVFSEIAGKVGHNWWLWVFSGLATTVFVLDPSRSGQVPRTYLQLEETSSSVPRKWRKLITDYYVVYRILGIGIRNAWCWAHIRRKYIEAARSVPALASWSEQWVARIAELYQRYHRRATAASDSPAWREADHALRTWVTTLEQQWRRELADPALAPRAAKVLRTVERQWVGLTVFLDDPRVPLDNNAAERLLRTPVVGRKNYYGSRARWSGALAAMCWTLWATASQNHLNPQAYLTAYLTACAENGGQPLDEEALKRFLPWDLTDADRAAWAAPAMVAS